MFQIVNNPQGAVAKGLSDAAPNDRRATADPRAPSRWLLTAPYALALRPAGDCAGFV